MKYTKIKKILKETENQVNQSTEVANQKPHSPKKSEDNDELTNEEKETLSTNGHGGTDSANQDEEESASQGKGEEIEVWGSQFDRKSSTMKEREKVPVQKKENSAYLQKLGSKMFQQSLKQKNNKVCSFRFFCDLPLS